MNALSPSVRSLRGVAGGLLLLIVSLMAGTARADVPGRVGRIAFAEGDVQAYSESDPEWKVAYLNQPITSHNSVFVGDAGRVEITIGSTTVALDAGSQIDIEQLDDNTFNASVVRGRASVRVRRFDPSDAYNLDVPGADIALLRPGRYRIDALQSTGGVTVFEGQASVQSARSAMLVEAGNGLRVVDDPANPSAPARLLAAAPTPVALDDWVLQREGRFRNAIAERYVSPNMTGYEDLDANGRWATEEDVGPVWYPTTHVQPDWAPYRYGRWAYVAPWGYTWVDDAPWGFAPFHYGRWLQVGGRWGWCPGAYVARPVYAPALVGFYGGSNFSASFSAGVGPAVGWYPLAPWQRYSPHYTQSAAYVTRVNNITIVEPPRRYGGPNGRDWNRERGGVLAPQDAFRSQRSISRIAIDAPRDGFSRGGSINGADLPRPANLPGAVRRGPDNIGARPDFRGPRDFGPRTGDRGDRGDRGDGRGDNRRGDRGPEAPARAIIGAPGPNPNIDRQRFDGRNGLPPNDPRREDDGRRNGFERPPVPGAQQPASIQPVPDNRAFDRGRPFPQAGQPVGEAQGNRRFNAPQAPAPAMQMPMRSDGDTHIDVPTPQPVERRQFERPREQRNLQQAPPGMERQPVFERPQRIERPERIERPAPPVMPAPVAPAPVAPVARPQPVPQAPPPQVQPQQQAPAILRPQRAEPPGQSERPGIGRDR